MIPYCFAYSQRIRVRHRLIWVVWYWFNTFPYSIFERRLHLCGFIKQNMYISAPILIMFAACMPSGIMTSVLSCESSYIHGRLMGFGCAWDNRVNVTGVAEHECVLRCMLDKSCAAVNYDAKEKVCMWIEVPCPVLESHQYTHYQILAPQPVDGCIQWIATSNRNYPRIVKYKSNPNGYYRHAVIRLKRAGEVLPGKWSLSQQHASAVQNNMAFSDRQFEVLVVKESCSVRWVYYDASSGNPMTPGAIVGGHLIDGTPLYVAIACLTENYHVAGYYNHETRMGTCLYGRVRNNRGIVKMLTAPSY